MLTKWNENAIASRDESPEEENSDEGGEGWVIGGLIFRLIEIFTWRHFGILKVKNYL